MLISLKESEIAELPAKYELDPAPTVQPNWETRKFTSTGRTFKYVVRQDGTVVVKQITESVNFQGGTPLWL